MEGATLTMLGRGSLVVRLVALLCPGLGSSRRCRERGSGPRVDYGRGVIMYDPRDRAMCHKVVAYEAIVVAALAHARPGCLRTPLADERHDKSEGQPTPRLRYIHQTVAILMLPSFAFKALPGTAVGLSVPSRATRHQPHAAANPGPPCLNRVGAPGQGLPCSRRSLLDGHGKCSPNTSNSTTRELHKCGMQLLLFS